MKKISKLLSLLLASSMVIAIALTGCSGETGKTPPAPSSTASVKTEEKAPEDPALDTSKEAKLVMYLIGDPPVDNAKVFEKSMQR